ncbi:MAG: Peroxisomal membrane protein PMP27 [Stictis urceolatum]|nr:Peroxisomal membrane protein PMP27 [Stictis urceolata]
MVANTLVYHPTVAHYLRFVATSVGRDKLLRALQFFARFYSWYLYRTNATTLSIKPWDVIKKQFSLARKAMRLGKNVEHFKAAAVAADSEVMDPVLKYCAVGRQLGYGVYLTFDTMTFLDASGIRPMANAKKYQKIGLQAWLAGITFNIIAGAYSLYQLKEKETGVDKKDGEGVVESKKIQRERAAVNTQLISDLCDWTIPTASLGYTNFDEGIVGLAGTTSSLIGIWSVWKKTA